jgi:hypothetical protein
MKIACAMLSEYTQRRAKCRRSDNGLSVIARSEEAVSVSPWMNELSEEREHRLNGIRLVAPSSF